MISLQFSKQTKTVIAVILLLSIAFIIFYITQREAELPPMTVQEKKTRFNSLIVPAVNNVYANLMKQYEEIKKTA